MPRSLPSLLVLTLVTSAAAIAAEMGRPDLSGPEFAKRFAAGYGVLSAREPQITELESALLQKVAPLLNESPDLARSMLESILAEGKPVSAAFNLVLGNLYVAGRQWDLALQEYQKAIDKFPDFQRAWSAVGSLRSQQGRYREAAEALAKAVELGANDSQSYGMLGYALLQTDELVAAEVAYNLALLRSPGNIRWLEGKARILAESGRHAEAIAAIDELLRQDPANLEYWRLQANAHLGLEQLPESARALEIARLLGPLDANALFLLGNIYIRREMPDQALDAYLAAVRLDPKTTPTTLLNVARSLLGNEQFDLARRLLATLTPADDTWTSGHRLHHAMMQGRILLHDGDKAGSVAAFERALEFDPLNLECLYRLAQVHLERGETDKARYHLERISGDRNFEYAAQMSLANMLIKSGRFDAALTHLRRALRLNPGTEVETLYNRVRVAAQAGG